MVGGIMNLVLAKGMRLAVVLALLGPCCRVSVGEPPGGGCAGAGGWNCPPTASSTPPVPGVQRGDQSKPNPAGPRAPASQPSIDKAPPAQAAPAAVNQFNAASAQAMAQPMDANARANVSRAAANAMRLNQLIDKAAASGEYDTRNYGKLKTALAEAVRPPQTERLKNVEAPPRKAAATHPSPVKATATRPSQSNVAREPAQGGLTQTPLAPKQAAEVVASKVQSDLAGMSLAKLSTGASDASPSFVSALLGSLIQEGERRDGDHSLASRPNATSRDKVTDRRNDPLADSTAQSGSAASDYLELEAGMGESDAQEPLTPEEKEFLAALVKDALEKAKDNAPGDDALAEAAAAGSEEAKFLSALRNAAQDSAVFHSLSDDIVSSIQRYVEKDPKSRQAVRNIVLERAKQQWADASRVPVERAPASKLPTVTEWLGSLGGKGSLLVVAVLIAAAVGISEAFAVARRRKQSHRKTH